MLYLYLDESGDLGFDFVNKKPSGFFTLCVLAVKGQDNDRALGKVVLSVARRKFQKGAGGHELKGSSTSPEIKNYFYRRACKVAFRLYSVTLNKRQVCRQLSVDKDRIYNFLARQALERVDFADAAIRVIMTVDKSKSARGIAEFNDYVVSQLKAVIDPRVPLEIFHASSQERPGLQAADLFAWGVYRKYEAGDRGWYDVFRERLLLERLCLP